MGNYKIRTVKKGKKDFKPSEFKCWWKPKHVHMTGKFNKNCAYDHGNEDQTDWNKFGGLTWSIPNNKNAAMIGWRYNRNTLEFELAAYANINYAKHHKKFLASVKPGEAFSCRVEHDRRNKKYIYYVWTGDSTQKIEIPVNNRAWFGRLITSWFGGNKVAPHDMTLEMGWKKK